MGRPSNAQREARQAMKNMRRVFIHHFRTAVIEGDFDHGDFKAAAKEIRHLAAKMESFGEHVDKLLRGRE